MHLREIVVRPLRMLAVVNPSINSSVTGFCKMHLREIVARSLRVLAVVNSSVTGFCKMHLREIVARRHDHK